VSAQEWLRDFWRARRLEHWAARNRYPRTLARKYWTSAEYTKDASRLKAHGYRVVDEETTPGEVDIEPDASVYGRRLPGRMLVDVPLSLVTYERDPNHWAP